MPRIPTLAAVIPVTAAMLALSLSAAAAPAPPGAIESRVFLTAIGPGQVTVASFMSIRDTTLEFVTDERDVVLVPQPDGNNAEFRGWAGDCAPFGYGTCTIPLWSCVTSDVSGCALATAFRAVPQSECRWAAALFAVAGAATPSPADPCASPGGSPGVPPGDPAGETPAPTTPEVGTPLAGGVKVVRKARPLTAVRTTVLPSGVRASGRYPSGTTRIVQSLSLVGNGGVSLAGRCRITRRSRTFSCSAPARAGRWKVIIQARRGVTVLAQATKTVTVR